MELNYLCGHAFFVKIVSRQIIVGIPLHGKFFRGG
jgi:hypothetical protein